MSIKRALKIFAVCLLMMATQVPAFSKTYPSKPVRLIMPFPAGTVSDVMCRIIGEKLGALWGQPFVVENRVGANGNLGMAAAARAPADGYTLVMGNSSTYGVNPVLYADAQYDPIADFDPVVGLARSAFYLGVPSSLPIRSVADLVDYAKAHPGVLNFGSYGPGSVPHLAGEVLKRRAGFSMVHVAYKGSTQALSALLSGEIQVLFDSSTLTAQARAGTVRLLGVTSAQRWPLNPELPTIAERGFPGFAFEGWFALFAPKGTDAAIVQKINASVNTVLAMPDVRARLLEFNLVPTGGTVQALAKQSAAEVVRGRELVAFTGAKID